jgi:hypothetical protein
MLKRACRQLGDEKHIFKNKSATYVFTRQRDGAFHK